MRQLPACHSAPTYRRAQVAVQAQRMRLGVCTRLKLEPLASSLEGKWLRPRATLL